MTSTKMREDPLFMRNSFSGSGKWGLPQVKKQQIDLNNIKLIACSDTKINEQEINKEMGVHFFVDDYRFDKIYDHPDRTLPKYSQYKFLISPDYSLYAEMDLWRQLENVAKNRWVAAYWQSKGLTVIPTISWGLASTYEFCFDGIEYGSVVAIGMIGCKHNKTNFMKGYNEMLRRINPSYIICFGDPLPEMKGNIIAISYNDTRKKVR